MVACGKANNKNWRQYSAMGFSREWHLGDTALGLGRGIKEANDCGFRSEKGGNKLELASHLQAAKKIGSNEMDLASIKGKRQ